EQQKKEEEKKEQQDVEMEDEMDEELRKAIELSKQQPNITTTEKQSTETTTEEKTEEKKPEGEKPKMTDEEILDMVAKSVNQEILGELLSMDIPKIRAVKALLNTG